MKSKKRIILLIFMIITFFLISCSNKNSNESGESAAIENNNLSKSDYLIYLENKYNEYLSNLDLDNKYALDKADVTANDYIDNLKIAYRELNNKLVTLKNDLEKGVKTSDNQVKSLNDDIINLVDIAIVTSEKVSVELEDKGDKIATKTVEEIKSDLATIEEDSNRARERLADLVNNAKVKLKIE